MVALAALLFTPVASAQNVAVRAKVDKPDFDALPSPEFGGNTDLKKFNPKDWLIVEVEFEIDAREDGDKPDFVDELEFVYYVAVENGNRSKTNPAEFLLMEKSVKHVNIPVGEKVYSAIFLSPSSVKRISGGERAGKNIIKSVAVVVKYQGRAVGGSGTEGDVAKDGRTKPNAWWTQLGGTKLMRTEKIPLLAKKETPFAPLWWDRYAEPKEERR